MIIRKQTWIEQDNYIQIVLKEPYWDAGNRYGWEGEGLGVSMEAIRYAFKMDKKLRIRVLKYGLWEISPHMALRRAKEHDSIYIARDGKKLVIIPRIACKKIEKSTIQKKMEQKQEEKRDISKNQQLSGW